MIAFWSIIAVMTVATLVILVPPLMGRGHAVGIARRELNVAIFKDRLAELDRDLSDEVIDDAHYREARDELEHDLLQDTRVVETKEHGGQGRWAGAVVLLVVPVLALGIYWQLGGHALVGVDTSAPPQASATPGQQDVEKMVAGLAERMRQQPDDAQGWKMLGRSYIVMRRYLDAVQAYDKAYDLIGDEPDLLTQYAQALALVNENRFTGRPEQMVRKAMELDPNNGNAMFLSGISAFQREAYAEALTHWQKLLPNLPPNSDNARVVNGYIAQAQQALGQPVTAPVASAASADEVAPAAVSSGSAEIRVRVDLDQAIKAQAQPGDTVFIFARAPQGPPMPLAVVRAKVSDLPMTVLLDDSMAMAPNARLSKFTEVTISARVSRSGQAAPQSGDLQGRVEGVQVGSTDPVAVTIDQVI